MPLVSVSRLEDRESDMKKEYSKLHERYTDVRTCSFLLWMVVVQNAFLSYRSHGSTQPSFVCIVWSAEEFYKFNIPEVILDLCKKNFDFFV